MQRAQKINTKSFVNFTKSESLGGFVLIFCVIISLIIANSFLADDFINLLSKNLGTNVFNLHLKYSLSQWINDGLMAVFFLLIGLEIKREVIDGKLASFKKALLPIMAALGGMLVPAFIYYVFNKGTSTVGGWGIPMATDIAFAIAILGILGKKVPLSLKIFLTALAIVDDLGAILVIAFFYSQQIHYNYLLYALSVFTVLLIFNRLGIKNLAFYILPGMVMWYFIHQSGLHATIAGVLTAVTIPTNNTAQKSPLEKLEHALGLPVNLLIMPLFALANTNITFYPTMLKALNQPLSLGIICGLVLGKPLGITLFAWLAVKFKLARLPQNSNWLQIIGVGILGGIGFTMSIFIALLSLPSLQTQMLAKFSILTASVLAGVIGYWVLNRFGKSVS